MIEILENKIYRVVEKDFVNKGDGLVILEAMKMENVIKSNRKGVLKQTASMSGIKFTTIGSNFDDFTCRIYGVRVDT